MHTLLELAQFLKVGYLSATIKLLIMIEKKFLVNFYSDFSQLKYVFAEVETEKVRLMKVNLNNDNVTSSITNTEKIKLDFLNDEIDILKESNLKLIEENET